MRKALSQIVLQAPFEDAIEIILGEPYGVNSFAWALKSRGFTGFDLKSPLGVYADCGVAGDDTMKIELVCLGPWYLPELLNRPSKSIIIEGVAALRATIKLAGHIGLASCGVPPEWPAICDTLATGNPVRLYAEEANAGIVLAG
jgi:hypothetical protein